MQPTRQKPGQITWRLASRRVSRAPQHVREIAGVNIPKLLRQLSARAQWDGDVRRRDPVCSAAIAVIKALGGAAA
jgi:mannose/fructose-specific phosphotransferase system component IIA